MLLHGLSSCSLTIERVSLCNNWICPYNDKKKEYMPITVTYLQNTGCMHKQLVKSSLVPRPLPDFILHAAVEKTPQLQDKIWEWPGDEAK